MIQRIRQFLRKLVFEPGNKRALGRLGNPTSLDDKKKTGEKPMAFRIVLNVEIQPNSGFLELWIHSWRRLMNNVIVSHNCGRFPMVRICSNCESRGHQNNIWNTKSIGKLRLKSPAGRTLYIRCSSVSSLLSLSSAPVTNGKCSRIHSCLLSTNTNKPS